MGREHPLSDPSVSEQDRFSPVVRRPEMRASR